KGHQVSRPPGHPVSLAEFEADVRRGLSNAGQKELYSKYLYDDLGTALFEAITLLPEYGLTRADLRLLDGHGRELPNWCVNLSTVVELGSGSGEKARRILRHLVKDLDQILAAYNDPLGLTAAFNLNLLLRINRTLGANFDVRQFEHEARYNLADQRIEMHLRSKSDQVISIGAGFTVTLKKSETIWTESSYKFRPEQIRSMSERSGFSCEAQWIDEEWPFAQSLLRANAR